MSYASLNSYNIQFRSEPCGRLRKASVTIVVSNIIAYNCLFVATVVVAYTLLSYRVWTATCSELVSVCYIDQRQIHPSNSLESLVCVWYVCLHFDGKSHAWETFDQRQRVVVQWMSWAQPDFSLHLPLDYCFWLGTGEMSTHISNTRTQILIARLSLHPSVSISVFALPHT